MEAVVAYVAKGFTAIGFSLNLTTVTMPIRPNPPQTDLKIFLFFFQNIL